MRRQAGPGSGRAARRRGGIYCFRQTCPGRDLLAARNVAARLGSRDRRHAPRQEGPAFDQGRCEGRSDRQSRRSAPGDGSRLSIPHAGRGVRASRIVSDRDVPTHRWCCRPALAVGAVAAARTVHARIAGFPLTLRILAGFVMALHIALIAHDRKRSGRASDR